MSGTQMVPWLGQVKAEGTWLPMNEEFEADIPEAMPTGEIKSMKMRFKANTYGVDTVWMNEDDARRLSIRTGGLVIVENPQRVRCLLQEE